MIALRSSRFAEWVTYVTFWISIGIHAWINSWKCQVWSLIMVAVLSRFMCYQISHCGDVSHSHLHAVIFCHSHSLSPHPPPSHIIHSTDLSSHVHHTNCLSLIFLLSTRQSAFVGMRWVQLLYAWLGQQPDFSSLCLFSLSVSLTNRECCGCFLCLLSHLGKNKRKRWLAVALWQRA